MAAGIVSLSPELVDGISDSLSKEDIFNLRLSSRSLQAISLPTFTRRFFRVRNHILTKRSLAVLLEISRHPTFGAAMRTLVVSRRCITQRFSPRPLPSGYKEEMDSLRESGQIISDLAQVLRNAGGCQAVVLDDICNSPWGNAALEREIEQTTGQRRYAGEPWISRTADDDTKRYHCWGLVKSIIEAITKSQMPITKLDLTSVYGSTFGPALESGESPLQLDAALGSALAVSKWRNTLTTIQLKLNLADDHLQLNPITDFIRGFPHIETLVLEFTQRSSRYNSMSIAEVDIQLTRFRQLCLSLQQDLPNLRTLKLATKDWIPHDVMAVTFSARGGTLKDAAFRALPDRSRTASFSWWLALLVNAVQLERKRPLNLFDGFHSGCQRKYHMEDDALSVDIELLGVGPWLLDRFVKELQPATAGASDGSV